MTTLTFSLDGFNNRIVTDWRGNDISPFANARNHARRHGSASLWRADESLVLFYRDGSTLRRKTFPHARPA